MTDANLTSGEFIRTADLRSIPNEEHLESLRERHTREQRRRMRVADALAKAALLLFSPVMAVAKLVARSISMLVP